MHDESKRKLFFFIFVESAAKWNYSVGKKAHGSFAAFNWNRVPSSTLFILILVFVSNKCRNKVALGGAKFPSGSCSMQQKLWEIENSFKEPKTIAKNRKNLQQIEDSWRNFMTWCLTTVELYNFMLCVRSRRKKAVSVCLLETVAGKRKKFL